MSNYSKDMSGGQKHAATNYGSNGKLPSIPGAAMTGMHTFIDHQGEELSTHPIATNANQDTWPFSKHASVSQSREQNAFHNQS